MNRCRPCGAPIGNWERCEYCQSPNPRHAQINFVGTVDYARQLYLAQQQAMSMNQTGYGLTSRGICNHFGGIFGWGIK